MFGGIILCSKASTALIKLLIPEAPSAWPIFGFTYYVSVDRLTVRYVISGEYHRANEDASLPKDTSYCRGLYTAVSSLNQSHWMRLTNRIAHSSAGSVTLDDNV